MHEVLRGEIFPAAGPPVTAQRLLVEEDVAAHGHAFIEVAVVEEGSGVHVSSAGTQPLAPGSVVVLRPGDWHGYVDVDRLVVQNLYVGPEVFARELAWVTEDLGLAALLRPARRPPPATRPEQPRLEPEAVRRVREWCARLGASPPGVADRLSRLGHLVLVLGELAALGGDEVGDPAGRAHPVVLAGIRLLGSDIAGTWSVSRLAEAVSVSPAYLTRLFTEQVGLSPIAYLNRIRAERASELLLESDLPVAAVGAAVGWLDPSYASRRFRASFSLSPAQYRASFRPHV